MKKMKNIRKIIDESPLISRTEPAICQIHGPYEKRIIVLGHKLVSETQCPACKKEAEKKLKDEKNRKEQEMRIIRRLGHSRIPQFYTGATISNFEVKSHLERKNSNICTRYVNNWEDKVFPEGFGLLLYGQCGTGKTHLAVAILAQLIEEKNTWGEYWTVRDLIDHIRSTWNSDDYNLKRNCIENFRRMPLLVIDEIGIQSGTPNEREILFSIIDHRVSNRKPLILISNLNLSDLQTILGDRLFDRICSRCVPLIFEGLSKRKKLSADQLPF